MRSTAGQAPGRLALCRSVSNSAPVSLRAASVPLLVHGCVVSHCSSLSAHNGCVEFEESMTKTPRWGVARADALGRGTSISKGVGSERKRT